MKLIHYSAHSRRVATTLAIGVPLMAASAAGAAILPGSFWKAVTCSAFVLIGAKTLAASGLLNRRRSPADDRAIARALSGLPDRFTAITSFVGDEGEDSQGVVVIGPSGIFPLSFSCHRGTLRYRNGRWRRVRDAGGDARVPEDLFGETRRYAREVAKFLHRGLCADPSLCGLEVPVLPALVFVHAEKVEMEKAELPAMRLRELSTWVMSHAECLTPAQTAEVLCIFGAGRQPSPAAQPRRAA